LSELKVLITPLQNGTKYRFANETDDCHRGWAGVVAMENARQKETGLSVWMAGLNRH